MTAGTWTLNDTILLGNVAVGGGTDSFQSTLHIDNGAHIVTDALHIDNALNVVQAGATPCIDVTTNTNVYVYVRFGNLTATGAGTFLTCNSANALVEVELGPQGILGDATHAALANTAGTLAVVNRGLIQPNALGAGAITVEAYPQSSLGSPQAATLTVVQPNLNFQTDTNTAPLGPAASVNLTFAFTAIRLGIVPVNASISGTNSVAGDSVTVELLRDAVVLAKAVVKSSTVGGFFAVGLTSIDELPDHAAHNYIIQATGGVGNITVNDNQASLNANEL